MCEENNTTSAEELSVQLAELSSVLSERVASDRTLLAEIKQYAAAAVKTVSGEKFKPLFTELLLAVDRLCMEEASEGLAISVADEILDICMHYGLEKVDAAGSFNPRVHEAASVVATGNPAKDRAVVSVERPGYMLAGALLRPARVVVARYDASLAEIEKEDADGQPIDRSVNDSQTGET